MKAAVAHQFPQTYVSLAGPAQAGARQRRACFLVSYGIPNRYGITSVGEIVLAKKETEHGSHVFQGSLHHSRYHSMSDILFYYYFRMQL